MDRRTFSKLISAGGIAGFGHGLNLEAQPGAISSQEGITMKAPDATHDSIAHEGGPASVEKRPVKWPDETLRRLLVDTHVPDWDSLMANFDAADYVGTIAKANFQALMQYANSHVGLSLWRTQLGKMHAGMKGRDYFGEVMAECRRY